MGIYLREVVFIKVHADKSRHGVLVNLAVIDNSKRIRTAIQIILRRKVVLRRDVHLAKRKALHVEDINNERHRCRRLEEVHVAIRGGDGRIIHGADNHTCRINRVFLARTHTNKSNTIDEIGHFNFKPIGLAESIYQEVAPRAKRITRTRIQSNKIQVDVRINPMEVFSTIFVEGRISWYTLPIRHVAKRILR